MPMGRWCKGFLFTLNRTYMAKKDIIINPKERIYNIVIRSIKEHLDKGGSWDCYGFFVAIKMNYASSRLSNPSVKTIKEMLGVGSTTAGRILDEALKSPLFKIMENGDMVAVSPKTKTFKMSRICVPYRSDVVIKDNKKYNSFRELVDELKRNLLCYLIGYVGNNKFMLWNDKNACAIAGRRITQSEMVKYLGISRAEVRRLLTTLEASDGVIINEGHKHKRTLTMVCKYYPKEPNFVKERRLNGEKRKFILGSPEYKTIWVGSANTYRLTNKTARFVNRIWNRTTESSFFKEFIAKAKKCKEQKKTSVTKALEDNLFTILPASQIPF